jgi:uncharacterized protein (DUF2132 family)
MKNEQKTEKVLNEQDKFNAKAKMLNECSNYVKEKEALTIADVKKFVDASLKYLENTKDVKEKLKTLFAKKFDDNKFNANKTKKYEYKRIERVFSSEVAKTLHLSTSTAHEKITESVNLANRSLIKSFFSYSDESLDSIRCLVYKFKI